jgi:transaldolase
MNGVCDAVHNIRWPFRGCISSLSGCDLLTIGPDLFDQLEKTEGTLVRFLDPVNAKASKDERLHLNEKTFRWMHNEDVMATGKLAEGIRKSNSDARHLEGYALSQVKQKVA